MTEKLGRVRGQSSAVSAFAGILKYPKIDSLKQPQFRQIKRSEKWNITTKKAHGVREGSVYGDT